MCEELSIMCSPHKNQVLDEWTILAQNSFVV
jgi:hypothetical protein